MAELRIRDIDERDYRALSRYKGSRSWRQVISTLRYIWESREYITNVINRNFDHAIVDLPVEMHGVISSLRVIALKSQDLNDTDREALMVKLVETAQSWQQKRKKVNVGDLQFNLPDTSEASSSEPNPRELQSHTLMAEDNRPASEG